MKTVIDSDALYRAFCAAWEAEDPDYRGTREGFMAGFYSACVTYLPGEPVAVAKYDKCSGNAGVRWCVVPVADAPMLEDGEPLYRLSDLLTFTKAPLALSGHDDTLNRLRSALADTTLFVEMYSNRWDTTVGAHHPKHPSEIVEVARALLKDGGAA